jgi:hypothetical protein
MSRYANDIATSQRSDEVEKRVSNYLIDKGFERTTVRCEQVWRKGTGWFLWPQLIKVTPIEGGAHLEAWCTFALLPGVYIGETGTTSKLGFGFAVKKTLRKRVDDLERLLGQA